MHESDVTNADQPLVLSVGAAARMLGISRARAYELVARGELAHIRLGRRVVVPRRAIDQLIEDASR
ncbi:MAG: helix-turn-helix domain-containing protein [Actinomycetota bacterium]|nr:helix-turn-helix domain-containing protein [Actinomycetota bacterium]